MIERDLTEERPERFIHAVRSACCEACNYPDCGCKTVAEILRSGINAWEAFLSDNGEPATEKEQP